MSMRTSGVIPTSARPLWAAVLSALAIGVLSAARPATAQTTDSATGLQSLVGDLGLQLDLRYRANLPEYDRRYEQFGQAVAAWNVSARSSADREQMAAWLRGAIRSSMPGSDAQWPAVPQFAQAGGAAASSPVGVVRNKPVVADQDQSTAPPNMLPAPMTGKPLPMATQPQSAPSPMDELPALGPMPAENPLGSQSASPAGGQAEKNDDTDVWLSHPAANDLPADLMLGDPFRDDPLPATAPPSAPAPLPELPPLPGLE